MLLDREGNYWVSLLKNGIHVIPNLNLLYYDESNSDFISGPYGVMAKGENNELLISDDKGKLISYDFVNEKMIKSFLRPRSVCIFAEIEDEHKRIVRHVLTSITYPFKEIILNFFDISFQGRVTDLS